MSKNIYSKILYQFTEEIIKNHMEKLSAIIAKQIAVELTNNKLLENIFKKAISRYKFINSDIKILKLSERTEKILRSDDINLIREILCPKISLKMIPGFGKKCAEDVERSLKNNKLEFDYFLYDKDYDLFEYLWGEANDH